MRNLLLVLLVLLLLFVALPAAAQAPASASAADADIAVAIVVAGTFIVLGLITAHAYVQGQSVRALYQSLPTEFQTIVRVFLEALMEQAAKTPTTLDDDALFQLADRLGYNKTQLPDGRIILSRRPAEPLPPN